MNKTRRVRRLFTWSYVILIGLDVPMAVVSLPVVPWKEASHANLDRPRSKSPEAAMPLPISDSLDAWSQYDNPEEGSALEGDIRGSSLFRKTTTTDESLIWPNGVVRYFIDDTIVNEPAKTAVLEDAMETIMDLTCVRFVRIYADVSGNFPSNSWVNISGNERGCFSDLGHSAYAPSKMNLDVNRCFRYKGHALHEILHTLGVFHEHMRPDRDEYIEILWDNIREGDALNFRIMDEKAVTNYGLPYDYDSVMHYSMTSFSKNKSVPTIVPRKKYAEIGQRNHLSFYDVQKLLRTYKCNEIDTANMDHKVTNDHTDRLKGPNSNTTSISHVASIKSLRDSQLPYMEPMVQYNIPNTLKTHYYEYDYPDYVLEKFLADMYYCYG